MSDVQIKAMDSLILQLKDDADRRLKLLREMESHMATCIVCGHHLRGIYGGYSHAKDCKLGQELADED